MKLTVERDLLSAAMDTLATVVMDKNVIPILSHIKIDAADGTWLYTHNLDQCVMAKVEAEVSDAGTTCVPFKPLANLIAGSAKGSHVIMETKGNDRISVRIGRSRYEFGTLPATDFPAMLKPIDPDDFSVSAEDISYLIDSTQYAMRDDEKAFAHESNMFLFNKEGHLASLTTKGASVSLAWLSEPQELNLPSTDSAAGNDTNVPGIFLSKQVVGDIKKLAKESGLTFSVGRNAVSITTNTGVTYASKLIEGKAPNWKLIPIPSEDHITIDRDELLRALSRLYAVQDIKTTSAVKMQWKDGNLKMFLRNGFDGTASGEEEIECETKGERETAANLKFMQEAIESMTGDHVQICVDGIGDPIHILSPSESCRHAIVMPMRF